mmetsp:Transcript_28164/g.79541  ORF Transcript_28164/g.79541 Transcript_28164/m.79541 type:complete len:218 (-) Transcript_28164:470-1123(-)
MLVRLAGLLYQLVRLPSRFLQLAPKLVHLSLQSFGTTLGVALGRLRNPGSGLHIPYSAAETNHFGFKRCCPMALFLQGRLSCLGGNLQPEDLLGGKDELVLELLLPENALSLSSKGPSRGCAGWGIVTLQPILSFLHQHLQVPEPSLVRHSLLACRPDLGRLPGFTAATADFTAASAGAEWRLWRAAGAISAAGMQLGGLAVCGGCPAPTAPGSSRF